ncbi:MAG: plasmid maintenance system killer protein [Moorea sp. SIO2B7]|nr:plasmid maintenance system killer protein [Moorena sp. SIO2B7]
MIKSFKCKQTEKLYNKEFVKKFSGFARQAEKKLRLCDAAEILEDLSQIGGNRFESLIGDRQGQYSIRINDQLRLLDAAEILEDLSQICGNRFESLIRDRQGQYSIRINDQWRICFRWDDAPCDVEIVDYH